jgi:hypothetical protein
VLTSDVVPGSLPFGDFDGFGDREGFAALVPLALVLAGFVSVAFSFFFLSFFFPLVDAAVRAVSVVARGLTAVSERDGVDAVGVGEEAGADGRATGLSDLSRRCEIAENVIPAMSPAPTAAASTPTTIRRGIRRNEVAGIARVAPVLAVSRVLVPACRNR